VVFTNASSVALVNDESDNNSEVLKDRLARSLNRDFVLDGTRVTSSRLNSTVSRATSGSRSGTSSGSATREETVVGSEALVGSLALGSDAEAEALGTVNSGVVTRAESALRFLAAVVAGKTSAAVVTGNGLIVEEELSAATTAIIRSALSKRMGSARRSGTGIKEALSRRNAIRADRGGKSRISRRASGKTLSETVNRDEVAASGGQRAGSELELAGGRAVRLRERLRAKADLSSTIAGCAAARNKAAVFGASSGATTGTALLEAITVGARVGRFGDPAATVGRTINTNAASAGTSGA